MPFPWGHLGPAPNSNETDALESSRSRRAIKKLRPTRIEPTLRNQAIPVVPLGTCTPLEWYRRWGIKPSCLGAIKEPAPNSNGTDVKGSSQDSVGPLRDLRLIRMKPTLARCRRRINLHLYPASLILSLTIFLTHLNSSFSYGGSSNYNLYRYI